MEVQIQIPAPVQWLKRSGTVTATVQVAAAAQIQSLAWELPHVMDAAIKFFLRKQLTHFLILLRVFFFFLSQKKQSGPGYISTDVWNIYYCSRCTH